MVLLRKYVNEIRLYLSDHFGRSRVSILATSSILIHWLLVLPFHNKRSRFTDYIIFQSKAKQKLKINSDKSSGSERLD